METVKINMVPKGAVKAAHASQGDAARVVRFELFDEFLPYTLDGSEDITLTVVRPDTEEIVTPVTNTEEAYIDVTFNSEMTALRGVANCEITISKSGAVIGSHNFDLNIERGAYGENITVETAQGVIATFTTGVIDNLVGLKTTFEPSQDLHGFDTPWIDSNVVNKAPYLVRALAGTAARIGNYEYNKLVGGTYAFNQLVKWINTTVQGLSATLSADGTVELSGISTGNYSNITENTDPIDNHVYYFGKTVISNPNNITFSWSFLNVNMGPATKTAGSQYLVRKCVSHTGAYTGLSGFDANTDFTGVKAKIICIDLTQMLGSTIADYIYSLETATAGAGVSFVKSLFGADYYPHNSGELMSVKTSAHNTIGFNRYDKTTAVTGKRANLDGSISDVQNFAVSDYIFVLGQTDFYLKNVVGSAGWYSAILYDVNKNALNLSRNVYGSGIVSGEISIPNNCAYIRVNTYSSEIDKVCVNVSSSRNGEYEPYVKHSYALDPDLELRGIPKLDANNNLYYDGDTYESNGDVTRRFSPLLVDGVNVTVTAWNRPNAYGGFACYISINDIKGVEKVRSLCDKFTVSNKSIDDAPILSAGLNSGANSTYSFILPASVTTQAEANTWFQNNPTTVLYEKDTPTTESADPFTDPQVIDASGSEEFIDARAVSIPVGHESYYANICEITGIDEINLFHTGVNLFDEEYPSLDNTVRYKSIYVGNGTFTMSSTAPVVEGACLLFFLAGNVSSGASTSNNGVSINQSRTVTTDDGYITVGYRYYGNPTYYPTDYKTQIEKGSQASEYKAYTGESALVEIGQTVYGGYYDKDLGIVLTHVKYVYDGSENWNYGSDMAYFVLFNQAPSKSNNDTTQKSNIMVGGGNSYQNYGKYRAQTNGAVCIGNKINDNTLNWSGVNEFRAFLSKKALEVCYELADPIIIPADAVNFEAVKGVNNVWSDTNGETEVKYYVKE